MFLNWNYTPSSVFFRNSFVQRKLSLRKSTTKFIHHIPWLRTQIFWGLLARTQHHMCHPLKYIRVALPFISFISKPLLPKLTTQRTDGALSAVHFHSLMRRAFPVGYPDHLSLPSHTHFSCCFFFVSSSLQRLKSSCWGSIACMRSTLSRPFQL